MLKATDGTALVLEGGGMRGIFTIGVLDAFMDAGLTFPYVVGVSAGACNGCSFVTRQRGRARYSNVGMVERYGHQYLGLRLLLTTGNIFNVKLLYDDLPNRLWPYDYDGYFRAKTEFEMVTTNLRTGRPCYFSNRMPDYQTLPADEARRLMMKIVLASSSLPYVSRTVWINGEPMLDGGIADSVPVERARQKGYNRAVVVLTRNAGYRKRLPRDPLARLTAATLRQAKYHDYPAFRAAMHAREAVYNDQLALVERLEAEGKADVIRPLTPLVVDRIERDPHKLNALYDEGLRAGRLYIASLNK